MPIKPHQAFLRNLLYLDIITLVVDEVPVPDGRSLHESLSALVHQESGDGSVNKLASEPYSRPAALPLDQIQKRLLEIAAESRNLTSQRKVEALAPSASLDGFAPRAMAIYDAIDTLHGDEKKFALQTEVSQDELRATMQIGHLVVLGREEVKIRTRMSLLGDVVTWVKREPEAGLTAAHQHSVESAVGWWGTLLNTAVSALGSLFKLLLK
jgi:hypothetical protein